MAALTVGNGDHGGIGDGDGLFAMLASCGLLLCMISTLMGIKIWWFKHRLTFDQNSMSNGAAGRATPTVPLRKRSNREKRISQEIHEPVEVHGIFRRRQEDDLDIVPTKQWPPIRIRNLSQSTPSLFPPIPQRHSESKVRSEIFKEYEPPPPAHKPPIPPLESPQPPTLNINLVEELPTFDELEQKYRQIEKVTNNDELKNDSNENIVQMRMTPPQPPKRLSRHSYNEEKVLKGMHKFMKIKLPTAQLSNSLQNINERRALGRSTSDGNEILSPSPKPLQNERPHSVEEFGARRPTGYIKYEEIDTDGLEDFRQNWETFQTSSSIGSPISFQCDHDTSSETLNGHNFDHTLFNGDRQSWGPGEHFVRNFETPVSHRCFEFSSDDEFSDELGDFTKTAMRQTSALKNSEEGAVENCKPQSHHLKASTPSSEIASQYFTSAEEMGEVILRTRQPVSPKLLWDELEANIKQDEHEKQVWYEIEKDLDLNRDFVTNIEEEFSKIRHSYEENEAAFLDNNCKLKRIPKQVVISTPEPEGFGKTIDEDWINFENLVKHENQSSQPTDIDKSVVQFDFSDLEDVYDNETMSHEEKRPTVAVRNTKFKQELSKIEDEDEPISPIYNAECIEIKELNFENDITKVKQPAATDERDHHVVVNLNDDYWHEHNKDSIFEPAEESHVQTKARARPRPRQKVTFDFNSTEYFHVVGIEEEKDELPSASQELDISNDALNTQTLPKPMQRITKMHYTYTESNEDNSYDRGDRSITPNTSQPPVSFLFGNQMSPNDEMETELKDSWTTIRQRGQMTTTTSISTSPPPLPQPSAITPQAPLIFFNATESPTPIECGTNTHPLTVLSLTVPTEDIPEQQYLNRLKPHAVARKQYFEQNDFNSTEA